MKIKNHKSLTAFKSLSAKDKKNLIIVIILALAIPLTIALVLTEQNFRQRAAEVTTPFIPSDTASITGSSAQLNWNTNTVSLISENSYILIDNKTYLLDKQNLRLNSKPIYLDVDGYYKTTLESTWTENGVEMRLFLYFRYFPGKLWELYNIGTYDGTSNNKWLYYDVLDKNGNKIQNEVGKGYTNSNLNLRSNSFSESSKISLIHFESITLKPFLNFTPVPSPTQSPAR